MGQNSEGVQTVNTKVSEDSIGTHNETDDITKVGLLCKENIKNMLFCHFKTL